MLSEQAIFLFSLHLIGLIFALLFAPKISVYFACLTSFLWGILLYFVFVILVLFTKIIPYNFTSILAYGIILVIVFLIILAKKKGIAIDIQGILFIIGYSCILFFVIWFFSNNNYSKASFDSMLLVNMGRYIASGDIHNWIMGSPKSYGMLIPVLHSSSKFWGMDYSFALQPTISFVFACILLYINGNIIKLITPNKLVQIFSAFLSTAIFFSTPIIWFNTSYIHTNFISGVYLLVSLYAFMMGMKFDSKTWLVIGTLSLIGFGFCRTENSIFAVIILLLVYSNNIFNYKKRNFITIPFSTIFILWWFLVIHMKDTPFSDVLTKDILFAYIAIFLLFILGILLSGINWIEKKIIPKIPLLLSVTFSITYILMGIFKFEDMSISLLNVVKNSFITKYGGYGLTSYLAALGLIVVIVLHLVNRRHEKIITDYLGLTVFTFIMFVMIMGFFRTPYRLTWGDSANRMFVALLPITLTYLFSEIAHFSFQKKNKAKGD